MMFILGLLIGLAHAAPALLTAPMDKSDSQQVLLQCQKALKSKKNITVRNARFFVTGKGYRQRVVIEGFQNEIQASEIAKKLHATVPGLVLLTDDGRERKFSKDNNTFVSDRLTLKPPEQSISPQQADGVNPTEPKRLIRISPGDSREDNDSTVKPESSGSVKTAQSSKAVSGSRPMQKKLLEPTSTDILKMVQDPLGRMSSLWEESTTERLSFSRALHDPSMKTKLQADHMYFRDGESMRLEVQIREGVGQDSTTILDSDGKSWIVIGERSVVRNGARVKEILNRFSSSSLLSILLNFSSDIETDGPWRELSIVSKTTKGWKLKREAKVEGPGIIEAEFGVDGWNLLSLSMRQNDGDWRYSFSDYRQIGSGAGVVVPHSIVISRNKSLVEEIAIVKLELNVVVEKKLFKHKN